MEYILSAATQTSTAYSWIYIIIGLLTIMGAGGAYGLIQWIKKQGVRDAKLDALIDPKTGIQIQINDTQSQLSQIKAQLSAQDKQLEAALQATRSNGLTTDEVGDIAKRTEIAVNDINNKLQQHIGDSNRVHTDLWKAIEKGGTKT